MDLRVSLSVFKFYSRSSDCESDEDDELNDARLSFHENEEKIGALGDSVSTLPLSK